MDCYDIDTQTKLTVVAGTAENMPVVLMSSSTIVGFNFLNKLFKIFFSSDLQKKKKREKDLLLTGSVSKWLQ